jgi:hypothetical protein
LDGSFVAAKRGGDEIGITKIGKGSKVMTIADGNGLPIGIYVTSPTIMRSSWFSPPWSLYEFRKDAADHDPDSRNWWQIGHITVRTFSAFFESAESSPPFL